MLITPPLKWPISPACAGNAMVIAAMRLRRRFIPLSRTLTCSFLFIEFQLLPRKGRREVRLLQDGLERHLDEHRLRRLGAQLLRALLQCGDDVEMLVCDVVLLGGVFRDIVEFYAL